MQKYKNILLICICLFALFKEDAVFANKQDQSITIGSKMFTENILLAEMLSILLEEKYHIQVVKKFNMGGTKLIFDSLRSKKLDIYPEYTGTGYTMLLKMTGETNPKRTYRIVKKEFLKKFKMVWSLPLGFENTYALAVRKKDHRFRKIHTISQLKGIEQSFHLGMGHEFIERKDGFSNFSNKYQLHFQKDKIITMNPALMYAALDNKEVDMIMAYSTDGRIQAFYLKTLKDDQSFFPSYAAAYLTRQDVLEVWPEVQTAFADLENSITEKEMITLNNQVDQLDYGISQTARNFLIQKKLLVDKGYKLQKLSLLNYYLSKKKYFLNIFIEHLILVFISLLLATCLGVLIGVCAVFNFKTEKVVFALVNTLQTVPSIALLGLLIPVLGIGFAPAILALFLYSLLPVIRNTFEGIKNVDGSYIEAAAGIGLTAWQILTFVQIPLALPVILAGVRTAAVIVVGTATLAAYIGAGGLGDPIFRGIATLDSRLIFLGAVPTCLLAIAIDTTLAGLENIIISKGLKLEKNIKHIEFN